MLHKTVGLTILRLHPNLINNPLEPDKIWEGLFGLKNDTINDILFITEFLMLINIVVLLCAQI